GALNTIQMQGEIAGRNAGDRLGESDRVVNFPRVGAQWIGCHDALHLWTDDVSDGHSRSPHPMQSWVAICQNQMTLQGKLPRASPRWRCQTPPRHETPARFPMIALSSTEALLDVLLHAERHIRCVPRGAARPKASNGNSSERGILHANAPP